MIARKASIKETGEQLNQDEWARFEKAVETAKTARPNSRADPRNATSKTKTKRIKEKTTEAPPGKT